MSYHGCTHDRGPVYSSLQSFGCCPHRNLRHILTANSFQVNHRVSPVTVGYLVQITIVNLTLRNLATLESCFYIVLTLDNNVNTQMIISDTVCKRCLMWIL
ncbi:uncharacterized protein LOC117174842 [Belonocnema kinseyi]|uniref:uncharacterized protein LOC117174842 n=1 Tax=Belonocnema kinseyi TaxID=2817044 RepID=UPI00143DB229|nr:uncharacterized protein LOC117174842 [Belonocnema kinseyi]